MDNRRKICFVVDTLTNHGAERYLYEVLKVLDKTALRCTVYCLRALEPSQKHYVQPILDLGVEIVEYREDLYPQVSSPPIKKILTSYAYRIKPKNHVSETVFRQKLAFLEGFDVVSIIKWEVYTQHRELFDALPEKNIHVLSGLAQYGENPYGELPRAKTRFVVMYAEQEAEILQGRPKGNLYTFRRIPLLIDTAPLANRYNPSADVFTLAVFSRINMDQPTIFFLFVAHLLKKRGHRFRLCFYGKQSDPSFFAYYQNTCRQLDVEHEVLFMGHTFDIGGEIEKHGLGIGLMNCLGHFIGYSSIEIRCQGLPVLFYNVAPELKNPGAFDSIEAMADRLEQYIADPEALSAFARESFAKAQSIYDIGAHVPEINRFFNPNAVS